MLRLWMGLLWRFQLLLPTTPALRIRISWPPQATREEFLTASHPHPCLDPAGAGWLVTREHRVYASRVFPEGILFRRPPDRADLCSSATAHQPWVTKPLANGLSIACSAGLSPPCA